MLKPLERLFWITLGVVIAIALTGNALAQVRSQPGSAANVNFVTGGSVRTVTLSGNPTLSDWFDQSVKAAASPAFAGLTVAGAAISAPLTGTTGSIGGGALGAGACATGTVNITGATTAMSATAAPLLNADPTNGGVLGVSISARVSSAGVVTVSVCAPIIGTPAAATYRVVVQ